MNTVNHIPLRLDLGEKALADLRWISDYYRRTHGLTVGEAMIVRRALETLRWDLETIAKAKVPT